MRRKRPIERAAGADRDASLFVIASEDRYATRQYFERFDSSRVQFRVLGTEDGRSDPEQVLRRLDEYKAEFEIGEGDQFWLLCDVDHRGAGAHLAGLTQVLKMCRQKNVGYALSAPCFEVWLLLHYCDIEDGWRPSPDEVVARVREMVGSYNKRRVDRFPFDAARVKTAIGRAKALPEPTSEVPEHAYSQVYRVVEPIIDWLRVRSSAS